MRRKGRSLSIEEKLQKMVVDNLRPDGGDLYRDKDTHKYYCRECFSEIPFLQKSCHNCGKKIDWSAIDTESLPASPPNPRFKPRQNSLLSPLIPPDFDYRALL